MKDTINLHLNQFDFDIRKSNDARFMDQKVTPDVLCIIADCAINLVADRNIEFTKDDIWNDKYFNSNVKSVFNKPDAKNDTTRLEYDKFTSQPLRMLAYSGVLSMRKAGRTNLYKIENIVLLEYIALKERNAYVFLFHYIVKVLTDSNFIQHFETFKNQCKRGVVSSENYSELKTKFIRFIIGNTSINGDLEVKRIFPKLLNVYSCENNIQGTIKGRLSKWQIYYTELMYNRPNWRDVSKEKYVSRNEAIFKHESLMMEQNESYSDYQVQKAIRTIKKMYSSSEVKDQWSNGIASHVHHIFPKSKFPEISTYLENLICLTPTQHLTKAHPNNTHIIDVNYQLICLLSKADSINKSLSLGKIIYRKESFIIVINKGLSVDFSFDLDFKSIKSKLTLLYNNN